MELYVIAAFVVVAVVVLVGSIVAGRRGHDPATSVRDFTRALSALERTDAPKPGSRIRTSTSDDDKDNEQLHAG